MSGGSMMMRRGATNGPFVAGELGRFAGATDDEGGELGVEGAYSRVAMCDWRVSTTISLKSVIECRPLHGGCMGRTPGQRRAPGLPTGGSAPR